MELPVKQSLNVKARGGFVLPAVLLVALVGVLFGLGRLMMYRYQCQLRIDRQCEIEKENAVRSMLNWLRVNDITTIAYTNELRYSVDKTFGRSFNVISVPTPVLFPDDAEFVPTSSSNHFSVCRYRQHCRTSFMKEGVSFCRLDSQQFGVHGYGERGGMEPVARSEQTSTQVRDARGRPTGESITSYVNEVIDFGIMTNYGARSVLSVEMSKIGGWWNDDYGRRYEVDFEWMATNTYQRMYLMRATTPWPLSGSDYALCLEFKKESGQNVMQAFYCHGADKQPILTKRRDGVVTRIGNEDSSRLDFESGDSSLSSNGPKGIQLAGQYLSIFGATAQNYIFSRNVGYLEDDVYLAFARNMFTGAVDTCDLKMVLEVEYFGGDVITNTSSSIIKSIEVSPAYKFDIYLEYPVDPARRFEEWGENWMLATIAQPCWLEGADSHSLQKVVITYDSHGTDKEEWKKRKRGFR